MTKRSFCRDLKMKLPHQDTERVKSGLRDAITLLCKTGLNFHDELNISGLLGITLDHNEVFLVDIKEVIKHSKLHSIPREEKRRRKSSTVTRLLPVTDLKNAGSEEEDSEEEYPYGKQRRLDINDSENASGRSSVDSHNEASSTASLSAVAPQRFVCNTEVWFPESDNPNKPTENAVVVQPTGDYEEQASSRPSSKCSQQSEPHEQMNNEQPLSMIINNKNNAENTQPEVAHQCNDLNKQGKNKTLENALNKIVNQKQQDNGVHEEEEEEEEKPMNLSSRPTSHNNVSSAAASPLPLTIKEEVEDHMPVSVAPPPPMIFGGLPPGMIPEPELHARWLQNIAAHVKTVTHPPLLAAAIANTASSMPNNREGGSPLPPPDAHPPPHLPHHHLPFVLNTPKLPNLSANNVKKLRASPCSSSSSSSCSSSSTSQGAGGGGGHSCSNCGNDKTTTWRRMPSGQLVCNPCGLYYRLYKAGFPSGGGPRLNNCGSSNSKANNNATSNNNATAGSNNNSSTVQSCSNCGTGVTTMWRRNAEGDPVCNACGLYYKLHKVNRPLSMVKSEIHSRRRKPRSATYSPSGSGGGGGDMEESQHEASMTMMPALSSPLSTPLSTPLPLSIATPLPLTLTPTSTSTEAHSSTT